MIVNQIDEKDPENNKTIDTKSGVYLSPSDAYPGDRTYCFDVRDGDTQFDLITEKNGTIDEDKNEYYVSYRLDNVNIYGKPNRRGYVKLIKNLLNVHGNFFRSSERRFGTVQHVKVDVSPGVIAKIAGWERSIGGLRGWLPF